MKRIPAFLALIAFAIAGCEKTTTEGPQGKKLTIYKPADQTVMRGENNEIAITVARTNFEGALRIQFDDLPKGVKVLDADKGIPAGESRIVFLLHADPDADLVSNHVAKVTVEGPDEMMALETFQISVKDRAVP